jgi:hypothetical protein
VSAVCRFALEVALTWLMPVRSVRALRAQRASQDRVVRYLAGVLMDRHEVMHGPIAGPRHLHLVK